MEDRNQVEKIKKDIERLINKNHNKEALEFLKELIEIVTDDVEIYSMYSVVLSINREYKEAIDICIKGLDINPYSFDLNYNLACLYEIIQEYSKALTYFNIALNECKDETLKENIYNRINSEIYKEYDIENKIVFFVKRGLDSFIDDIISELSKDYIVKKVIVDDFSYIDKWMEWSDICWFEWCDELVDYGSKLPIASMKKIICRIHGYEVYTNYINNVVWSNVDNLIIVTPHIRRIFEERTNNLDKGNLKINTIFCGINLEKYDLNIKSKGFNLGYLGYINYKKNIPLTLDIFKKLYDMDNRYKLHIAGEFQDERTLSYLKYFIKEYKLEKSFVFYGWLNEKEKNQWFKNIDYMIISSIDEGLCFAAAESMSAGIKPILHNCEGIKDHYDSKYIFNNIDEAIEMIKSENYISSEYRDFIEEKYSLGKQMNSIKLILNQNKINKSEENPLVTIGVINYNNEKFLEKCLDSLTTQKYNNIEIIVVDDYSKDRSIDIIKRYKDKYSNIKTIMHEKNYGNGTIACKEIIENSTGEYFMFIASDDYLDNNNVITCYVNEFLYDKDIDYIYSNLKIVDEGENLKEIWRYRQYQNHEIIKETFLRFGSGILPMVGMFKKSFYIDNNMTWYIPKNNKVAPDTYNSLINIKNGMKIKYIDNEFYCYRHHTTNGTLNIKDRIPSIISVLEFIIDNFDINIYFPQYLELYKENIDIECYKNFVLGKYYKLLLDHYITTWRPWGNNNYIVDKNEIINNSQPIIEMINKYFNLSLSIDNYYKNEINKILKNIENLEV